MLLLILKQRNNLDMLEYLQSKKKLNQKSKQIKKALKRVKIGKYGICEECGKMINTDRLAVFPEATLCITCEKKKEK